MAWNYNGYGGYMPTQMAAQMPTQMPAQMQAQMPNPGGFICRPVTSRAEAEVFQIPFDGSTTYFVDTANGKIYSKTFNFANGTAPLVTYVQEASIQAPKYATMDDLNALRTELMERVKQDESNE